MLHTVVVWRNLSVRMRKGLSGSTLKIIAVVTMLIDHIGAAILARMMMVNGLGGIDQSDTTAVMQWYSNNTTLFQVYQVMRSIGRIAFPIFCFLLVEGFEHTHDRKKYALRLGLFALISEIPFDLAFSSEVLEFQYQNVFFTLFIGMLTMWVYRMVEEKKEWNDILRMLLYVVIVAAGMGAAELMKTDYAALGVLSIMVLYICRKNKTLQLAAGCISFMWESVAVLGFVPIAFYNGERGLKNRYIFYIFYPVHLLVLYVICYFMGISGYSAI